MKPELTVSFFPPYNKYYVSSNTHIDDYLRGGEICQFYPDYFSTFEEALEAKEDWERRHQ